MAFPSTSPQRFPYPGHSRLPYVRPARPLRKRGGQIANQNARKIGTFSVYQPGLFSATYQLTRILNQSLLDPHPSLERIVERARTARERLFPFLESFDDKFLPALQLSAGLTRVVIHAVSFCIPAQRLSKTLSDLARDPFGWFERGCQASQITRDANSFFPVAKKSTLYSPLPAHHPVLATNLTDSQWAVLAPLIPPDPHLDHLTGQPPVIIAANRWNFTQYEYTGDFQDYQIMQTYYNTLQRYPALCIEESALSSPMEANNDDQNLNPVQLPSPNPQDWRTGRGWGRTPGRPPNSPRALLDAIFWKLATGQKWEALPQGFPAMRSCRKYYRRLFLSGRLYTLLLALYNHMREEIDVDLFSMLDSGLFTATSSRRLALSPSAPATSANYTALLFLQLANTARTRLLREYKQTHPACFPLPDFRGDSPLSTGQLPGRPDLLTQTQARVARAALLDYGFTPLPPGQTPFSSCPGFFGKSALPPAMEDLPPAMGGGFLPLESTPLWKKWRKIERMQKVIAAEILLRLQRPPPS